MFGYVTVNRGELSPEQEKRYRAFYCGLCVALKRRHGWRGRVTVTYDLTFLAILLASLYEPETREESVRCAVHPRERHTALSSDITDYAADMNVLLAYEKCLDNWRDERAIVSRAEAALLRAAYARVKARDPKKCRVVEDALASLSAREMEKHADLDGCARCFGALLGELFVLREDEWADTLRRMGSALGQFIYLMDAYEDLPADRRRGRFNPLAAMAARPDYEDAVRDILVMLMGECASAFEELPLDQDLPILRNIVYSGVWAKYTYLRQKKGGDA